MALTLALAGLIPMGANAVDSDSRAGIVATASGSLNVRKSATTSSTVVTKLKKGTYVTLISKSGSWWRISYGKGQYGYCHSDYIDELDSKVAIVATSSGSLNVRSGAGTNYSKVGSLPKGETVLVLLKGSSWSRILYHGSKTGYVSNQYISIITPEAPPVTLPETPTEVPTDAPSDTPSDAPSDTPDETPTETPSETATETPSEEPTEVPTEAPTVDEGRYKSISLDVPYYQQKDERWASKKLGSSGKTIGSIGCTTTAIAMMESYRRGVEIYPDAMSKELRYTSSGSLYWPTDYIVDSTKLNLQLIYDCLLAGKPVVIGFNKSNGGQHWVLVYGYTGAETLKAQEFLIRDPGNSTRTTLAHLMRDYPTFRRVVYYR